MEFYTFSNQPEFHRPETAAFCGENPELQQSPRLVSGRCLYTPSFQRACFSVSALPCLRTMTSPPPRQPEQKSEKTSSRAHPFAISNVVDAPYEQNSPQRSAEAGISSVSASSAHSTIASLEMNPRCVKRLTKPVSECSSAPYSISSFSRRTVSYKLRILQHPNRVRCCGFGNKGSDIVAAKVLSARY